MGNLYEFATESRVLEHRILRILIWFLFSRRLPVWPPRVIYYISFEREYRVIRYV